MNREQAEPETAMPLEMSELREGLEIIIALRGYQGEDMGRVAGYRVAAEIAEKALARSALAAPLAPAPHEFRADGVGVKGSDLCLDCGKERFEHPTLADGEVVAWRQWARVTRKNGDRLRVEMLTPSLPFSHSDEYPSVEMLGEPEPLFTHPAPAPLVDPVGDPICVRCASQQDGPVPTECTCDLAAVWNRRAEAAEAALATEKDKLSLMDEAFAAVERGRDEALERAAERKAEAYHANEMLSASYKRETALRDRLAECERERDEARQAHEDIQFAAEHERQRAAASEAKVLARAARLTRCVVMAMGCLDPNDDNPDVRLAWFRLVDAIDGNEPRASLAAPPATGR